MKKGVSLISGVIFIGIVLVAVTIIYSASVPLMDKMRDSSAVSKWKTNLATLDNKIQEVASEGEGSRRSLSFRMDAGELLINGTDDRIDWVMETSSEAVAPRSLSQSGRVYVGSELHTSVTETTYNGASAYLVENSHLKVYLRKLGNSTSYVPYSTTELLMAIYNKDLGQWSVSPLDVYMDNVPSSRTGIGYTTVESSGTRLPYGRFTAYLQSNYSINYNIYITLESGADFIIAGAGM